MVNEGLRLSLAAITPEKSIAVLLEYLRQSLNSERVYVFEETDKKTLRNTYEWCANGVVPQKENLQDVPFEVVSLIISEGRIIGFYGVDNPPEKFLEQ